MTLKCTRTTEPTGQPRLRHQLPDARWYRAFGWPSLDSMRAVAISTNSRSANLSVQSTHQRMLTNAAALFRKHGYAGATTRQLASSLGIQSASLYHHIGRKEDLLHEICVTALVTITDRVGESVRAAAPPEAVRALIRAHIQAMVGDLDAHAVMLLELRSLSGERRKEVLALRDAYQGLVQRTLAGCQAAGLVRSDVPATELTIGLLNLLNWTSVWYRPNRGLSPDAIADLLSVIFLDGVANRDASPPRNLNT